MKFYIQLFLSSLRLIPHLMSYALQIKSNFIHADINRWTSIATETRSRKGAWLSFLKLMTFYPEFRNLYYKRIGPMAFFLRWLCPPSPTLFITTDDIGPRLFIQHGFSTIIVAQKIGSDCWINQQVTVGYTAKAKRSPIIGNNVTICAGAKVLGDIVIGDNVVIGANAVVTKHVPSNTTVAGVPAKIIRRDGIRVDEELK